MTRITACGLALAFGIFAADAEQQIGAPGNQSGGAIDPQVTAPAEQLGKAFAEVAARVQPAVVSVYSEKMVKRNESNADDLLRKFFGEQGPQSRSRGSRGHASSVPQQGMGSGIIIDKKGRILTNYHVVGDVDEIKVQLADKRRFEAEIVGSDPASDIAVIRIKGNAPSDLPMAELGDSDALQVGNIVMAIGSPFGFIQTVTTGVLSAKGRAGIGINTYEDFLQTDTAINPGNSGGPLVNMRGQVIGINSVIATSIGQFAGVGLAIPINMVKAVLPTLTSGGKIVRGFLGVGIQELTSDLAQQFKANTLNGALVSEVSKGGPADQAGLKPGDIILRVEGKSVQDTAHLKNLIAATPPDTRLKMDVLRDRKEQTLTATVGKLAPEAEVASVESDPAGANKDSKPSGKLGVSVQQLTPALAQQLGLQGDKGVVVTDVQEGGAAAMAGLHEGDLILEANHQPVTSPADLRKIMDNANNQSNTLLRVKREKQTVYILVPARQP
ncbi:MAG: protease Do [Verrucomicrobiales bacterium]|nr:protease Do [Verrucomicrobiales bacterium]